MHGDLCKHLGIDSSTDHLLFAWGRVRKRCSMFLWKVILVFGDVVTHKSKCQNDINLVALNVLGC